MLISEATCVVDPPLPPTITTHALLYTTIAHALVFRPSGTLYSILSPWGEDEGRRHVITATVRVYRRGVNNPEPVRNRFRERRLFWRKLGLYIFFSRIFMLITAVQKAEGMIGRLHAEV